MADVLMPSMPGTDILAHTIQPSSDGKIRITTIRLTPGDLKVIDRLMELTGHQQTSSLIRYGLRRLLWDVERAARGETPDNRPSAVREKGR